MRTNLGDQAKPGLWHTLGIITTALGVSNITPGGSAVGTIVTFKMLQRAGVDRNRAAAAMAVTSIGSSLVLNILLVLGLLTILPTHGPITGVLACIPTTGLLLTVAILAQRVAAHDRLLWATAKRLDQRLGVRSQRATTFLDELASQLESWRRQPRQLAQALGWGHRELAGRRRGPLDRPVRRCGTSREPTRVEPPRTHWSPGFNGWYGFVSSVGSTKLAGSNATRVPTPSGSVAPLEADGCEPPPQAVTIINKARQRPGTWKRRALGKRAEGTGVRRSAPADDLKGTSVLVPVTS